MIGKEHCMKCGNFFSPLWAKLLNFLLSTLWRVSNSNWQVFVQQAAMLSKKVHFTYLCMEEKFHINWENGRELHNVDYYLFFCFWHASPTLSEPQRCADISGFHLQWRGNSDVSLVSASIWLDRGNYFCLWNAALKLCSRPCFKFTRERVMAHSCLPAEPHQLWGDPAVSSPMCLKQWFPSAWFLAGTAACANPPQKSADWSIKAARGQLSMTWGQPEAVHLLGAQAGQEKPNGASKAIMFGGVRVLADALQKRSNLTICESPIEAS